MECFSRENLHGIVILARHVTNVTASEGGCEYCHSAPLHSYHFVASSLLWIGSFMNVKGTGLSVVWAIDSVPSDLGSVPARLIQVINSIRKGTHTHTLTPF